MSQTLPKVKPTDSGHDRGGNQEQVTCYRNAGKERPSLEDVSEDGACHHSRPKGKEEHMEHSK